MPRLAFSRIPLAAVLAAAVVGLAGCGGSGDDAATATTNSSPAASATSPADAGSLPGDAGGIPRTGAPLDEAGGRKERAAPDDRSQVGNREGDPQLPAAKGESLGDLPEGSSRKAIVRSGAGEPAWRISTRRPDELLCVDAAAVGATDPPSMCADAAVAALNLLADGAGVQSAVNPIRRATTESPQDVLVWGYADRAVDRIVVRYGDRSVEARLSKSSEEIDLGDAASAFSEGVQKAPERLRVRTFGISVPVTTGNPPTSATPESEKPKNGVVTLRLG